LRQAQRELEQDSSVERRRILRPRLLQRSGTRAQGVIPAAEYESFQNEMRARLEALPDDKGQPLNSLVFKPKEIYRSVRNVAPDLIVHFGGLYWRSIGTVGHSKIHVQEND